MSEQKYKSESITKFFIIAGSLADLSKFNFDCYNVQCLKINSDKLEDTCIQMTDDSIEHRTLDLLTEVSKKFSDSDQPFILLPNDFNIEFDEKSLLECFQIMLLLFPSDLSIYGVIDFQLFDNKYLHWTSYSKYDFHSTGRDNYFENYVYFQAGSLEEVNKFITLYHKRKDNLDYIETTINAYISSFRERRPDMNFLNLCISLESIIEGNTELSYRIKRNVAILCAEDRLHAEIIFDNLNLIYELRSKIVHAGKFKYEKVHEFLPYLQSLVSRLIIELILQNIKTLQELNRTLTFAGFGDRNELSTDSQYSPMTLNLLKYTYTFIKKLER